MNQIFNIMKEIKLLLMALMVVFASNASAQFVNTGRGSSNKSSEPFVKKGHFGIDLSVGLMGSGIDGGFGAGIRYVYDINQYVSIDCASINWTAPFDSPGYLDFLSVKTGVRGYSPKFFKNMRGYMNLDLGYGCTLYKTEDMDGWEDWDWEGGEQVWEAGHAFALEFGVGLFLTKNISFGYALNYDTFDGNVMHFLRIGFLF